MSTVNQEEIEGERLQEEEIVVGTVRNSAKQIEIAENLIKFLFQEGLNFQERNDCIASISQMANVDPNIVHQSHIMIGNLSLEA